MWTGTATIDSAAVSAIDIALWDLRGKLYGAPVWELLGGRVRDSIPVYNTCAGPGEGMPAPGAPRQELHRAEPWGLGGPPGEYDDYRAMWERPAELARELLDEGIGAMKLYTFRPASRKTLGTHIGPQDLARAIAPFRAIREAVGDEIDLMVDLLFEWTLAPAQRIVAALEEFGLLWIEDPLRFGARRHHAALQRQTRTPLAAFDYGAGLESYVDLVEKGGLSILRMDPQWVGGISESARIAQLADAAGPRRRLPRLHRPDQLHGEHPPRRARADDHAAGERPRLLARRLPRDRHRQPRLRRRTGEPAPRPGPRPRADGRLPLAPRPGSGPQRARGRRRRRPPGAGVSRSSSALSGVQ